jgi:hypothetical protein
VIGFVGDPEQAADLGVGMIPPPARVEHRTAMLSADFGRYASGGTRTPRLVATRT